MNNDLLKNIINLSSNNNINISDKNNICKSKEKIISKCEKQKKITSYMLSNLAKISKDDNNNIYNNFETKINNININKIINLVNKNENTFIEFYSNC